MNTFKSGVELNREFYREVVGPIVGSYPHAACLLGEGSDVLGFDTEMSMDHDWGPRLQILVLDQDVIGPIQARLQTKLPRAFQGFPVFYGMNEDGTTHMDSSESSRYRVQVCESFGFFRSLLGIDFDNPVTPSDWLRIPQQKLLEANAPSVYTDQIGLEAFRQRFQYFPNDVWLYLLASLWQRVGQEEHLVARAGFVGDELGAKIIAARVVRDLMRICFLLERNYIPYPKWFGTAFSRLSCGPLVAPLCEAVLACNDWQSRNDCFAPLYEAVAALQNGGRLCQPLPGKAQPFFGRPFAVIHLHSPFATALQKEILDPELKAMPLIGSRDIYSDSTDYLCGAQ